MDVEVPTADSGDELQPKQKKKMTTTFEQQLLSMLSSRQAQDPVKN